MRGGLIVNNVKDISHASCYGHICGFARQRIFRDMRHISRFVRYIMVDRSRKVIPYGLQMISSFKRYHLDEYTWCEDELKDLTRYIDKKGNRDVFFRSLKLQR